MPYRRYTKRRSYKRKVLTALTPTGPTRTALQATGAAFIDALGHEAVTRLKAKLGLNTEMHWKDSSETNVATTSTMISMANPTGIPIGDTVNDRTGNTVRVVSYQVNGRIQANTAATAGCLVRIVFIRWKQVRGRGNALDATDFLDAPTRTTSKYNMGDVPDATGYTVLFDKTYKVSISGQENDTVRFRFNYKSMNYHLKWSSTDTTGGIADLQSDLVRGYIMTSEPGANTPNYWADHRIRFVDN